LSAFFIPGIGGDQSPVEVCSPKPAKISRLLSWKSLIGHRVGLPLRADHHQRACKQRMRTFGEEQVRGAGVGGRPALMAVE